MFKHELGQVIQVTISGEEGHVKARAEYHNGPNQYSFTIWQLMDAVLAAGLKKMSCPRQNQKVL